MLYAAKTVTNALGPSTLGWKSLFQHYELPAAPSDACQARPGPQKMDPALLVRYGTSDTATLSLQMSEPACFPSCPGLYLTWAQPRVSEISDVI